MSDELKKCPFCGGTEQLVVPRTCDIDTPYDAADFAYPRVACKCGVEVAGKNWGEPPTAIAAWNRRALPSDGNWVVVPREPTGAMIRAGVDERDRPGSGAAASAIYRAMLAAAPSPSVAPDAKSGRTEE
jgi:Lar family restriction alleviation protein